ncbi:MAG: MmgE/PrpD family protein [Thermodesulfobacteriota bacterium]
MAQAKEPLRRELAKFIQGTSFQNLPAGVNRFAKLCILDLIGVSFAGIPQRTTSIISDLISAGSGYGEATLWGSDRKLPVLSASLINAVQGHAIDMDDGHRFANGHPGVVTIPGAVALAERENLTGRELIASVVIGYEIFIRLGTSVNPDLLHRGFHTTATIGSFSSAAVASKLLGLSVPQTENALALAGLQSAGLLEALSSGEAGKSFQVGKAVQSGLLAGLLAQQGADGPEYIFEGEKGFFRAFSGKPCDLETLCRDLGTDFQITSVYFKRHAACRHIHSAIDAVEDIVTKHRFSPEQISSIDIETYSIAKSLTGHLATTGSELAAKFSMPIAIALFLVFGKTDSGAFNKQNISNPLVQSIAQKVTVKANSELDADYPGKRTARVSIHTDNQTYRQEVACPKGEPENPLSDDAFMDKYETNARVLFSATQARKIRETILNMESLPVRELTDMLHPRVSS